MIRRRVFTVLVVAIAMFVSTAAAVGVSAERDTQPGESDTRPESVIVVETETTVLSSRAASGGQLDQSIIYSPNGCFGKSNNPHEPRAGGVKGVTQIDCDNNVPELRTHAQLWRKRWWGYEKIGVAPTNTNTNDDQVKASATYSTCEENEWRTEGDHRSFEGGEYYYGWTMQYAEVIC